MSREDPAAPIRVRVPADVDRPDRLMAGLTARQLLLLAGAGLPLWLAWLALHTLVTPAVLLPAAAVVAAGAFALAVGRRDGLPLDVWILHALRHRRGARILVHAPDGVAPPPTWIAAQGPDGRPPRLPAPLRLPARGVDAQGLIDLAGDGQTALVEADSVNFALRTPAEQDSLVGAFAGWLHALEGPAQILVRAQTADLGELADTLEAAAAGLPDPDLENAARGHAGFLADLADSRGLLRRRILVCLRDPAGTGVAGRWAEDTTQLLAAAEISARRVDAGPVLTDVLADTHTTRGTR